MNQTGVRSTGCALQARTKLELGADMNVEFSIFSGDALSPKEVKNFTTEDTGDTEENWGL